MTNPTVFLTNHALDRAIERFSHLIDQSQPIYDQLMSMYEQSQEDSRVRNDHQFMTYLYETYGYHKQPRFFVNAEILFVVVTNDDGSQAVVTVIDRQSHVNHFLRPIEKRLKPKVKGSTPFKKWRDRKWQSSQTAQKPFAIMAPSLKEYKAKKNEYLESYQHCGDL